MTFIEPTLAERITCWRVHLGKTQATLASAVGVSPSAVAQWELGETKPTTGHLERLAKAFGISLFRFLERLPPHFRQWRQKREAA